MNEIHEECGLFGIALKEKKKIAYDAYYALYALQHRGQEGAGIAISSDGVISLHKDAGLVNEVFPPATISSLPEGERAIGHVRYSTTGANRRLNAQPLMINHLKGRMAIAHNGNLTNDAELREELRAAGHTFLSQTDSEVIVRLIDSCYGGDILGAMRLACARLKGCWALAVLCAAFNGFAVARRGSPVIVGVGRDGCYAASDIYLMPSRTEPCGLAQMIASRYGAIPVTRETGGLNDSIIDFGTGHGNGWTFKNYSARDFVYVVRNAVEVYNNHRAAWADLRNIVFNTDFSWEKSAEEYWATYMTLT